MSAFRIGTRGSALALWQARTVAARLEQIGHQSEIVIIRTSGDEGSRDTAPAAGSVKRMFVKEIEDALLRGHVDIAVHSAKDMPSDLPDGLAIAAVLPREDPLDAIVLPNSAKASGIDDVLAHAGEAPVIGTSSVRRVAQLSALLPRATFAAIRGNVDTRLRKLDAGPLAAIVLAAAGLRRLGLASRISATIPIDRCVPAPGQGIVAIETRADGEASAVLAAIDDAPAAASLAAERAVVSALGGGCQLPLGAIALHERGELHMHGVVVSPDGRRVIRREARGDAAAPEQLGARLAAELARGGATAILDEVRRLE